MWPAFAMAAAVLLGAPAQPVGAAGDVEIRLATRTGTSTVGDVLDLTLRIRNARTQPVSVPLGLDVWHGGVELLIAYEDGPYRKYAGPSWGLTCRAWESDSQVVLAPSQILEQEITVLYNHGPNRDESTALVDDAPRMRGGYALWRPGLYRLKAMAYLDDGPVESPAIDVTVQAPRGVDSLAWERLSEDGESAFFIQTGAFRGPSTSAEARRSIALLREIAETHPTSRYVRSIAASLNKYDQQRNPTTD